MSFSSSLGPVFFAMFSAVAVSTGCNDDAGDDDSNDGEGSASLQSACEDLAETTCERFRDCIAAGFFDAEYKCTETATAACVKQSATSTVKPGDVDTCEDAYDTASCGEVTTGTVRCSFPAGTAAEGAPCKADNDCSSSFCAKGGKTCGTCAVPPAEGAACIQLGCGPDRTCKDGQTCVTPKRAGEACTEADSCVGGLDCVEGACTVPGDTVGAACDPAGKTAPRCNLLNALYCGEETRKCLALTPAQAGEACGFVDGQVIACTLSYRCEVAAGTLAGTCVRKAALGGACPKGDECSPGLACKDAKCIDETQLTCP